MPNLGCSEGSTLRVVRWGRALPSARAGLYSDGALLCRKGCARSALLEREALLVSQGLVYLRPSTQANNTPLCVALKSAGLQGISNLLRHGRGTRNLTLPSRAAVSSSCFLEGGGGGIARQPKGWGLSCVVAFRSNLLCPAFFYIFALSVGDAATITTPGITRVFDGKGQIGQRVNRFQLFGSLNQSKSSRGKSSKNDISRISTKKEIDGSQFYSTYLVHTLHGGILDWGCEHTHSSLLTSILRQRDGGDCLPATLLLAQLCSHGKLLLLTAEPLARSAQCHTFIVPVSEFRAKDNKKYCAPKKIRFTDRKVED